MYSIYHFLWLHLLAAGYFVPHHTCWFLTVDYKKGHKFFYTHIDISKCLSLPASIDCSTFFVAHFIRLIFLHSIRPTSGGRQSTSLVAVKWRQRPPFDASRRHSSLGRYLASHHFITSSQLNHWLLPQQTSRMSAQLFGLPCVLCRDRFCLINFCSPLNTIRRRRYLLLTVSLL